MSENRPGVSRQAGRPSSRSGGSSAPNSRPKATSRARAPREIINEAPTSKTWTFTRRMGILSVIAIALLVAFAVTLTKYSQERAGLEALTQQVAQQQQQVDGLNTDLNRWNDPNFIKSQARERLFYVLPGESMYRVIGAGDSLPTNATAANQASADAKKNWYATLWSSIEGADSAPKS